MEIEKIDLTLINLFLILNNIYVSHQTSRRLCLILILFKLLFQYDQLATIDCDCKIDVQDAFITHQRI